MSVLVGGGGGYISHSPCVAIKGELVGVRSLLPFRGRHSVIRLDWKHLYSWNQLAAPSLTIP